MLRTYIHDNRDGSEERVKVHRRLVRLEKTEEYIRAHEECDRRNVREGWERFVVILKEQRHA